MAMGDAVVASLLVKIGADIRDLKRGMGQADKAVNKFGSGVSGAMSSVGSALQSTGASISSTGAQFDSIIGRGARQLLGTMVKTATEFEAATKIMDAATLNLSDSMHDDLHEAAKLIGADQQIVGISAMDATEGMTNLLKAGQSVADLFGGTNGLNQYVKEGSNLTGTMRASADLAAASNLSFSQSTDAIAIAMATFGIEAKDAIKIADNFVKSADASVVDVNELAAALVNVGPVMAQMGVGLEDTNLMLALLSERGLKGSEAGTALKSMFSGLFTPTKKAATLLGELGVATFTADGQIRGVTAVMADLGSALDGLTDQQRLSALKTLFGSYGKLAGGIITGEGAAGFDEMTKKIMNAASAAEVAKTRTEGMAGGMEQLEGAVELFMINAGEPLIKDILIPLISVITKVIGGLAKSNPAFFKIAGMVLIAAAAFGPLLMGIGSIVSVVGTIISAGGAIAGAIGGIGAVIGGVLAPILVIGAAIAALVWAIKTNFLGIGDLFAKAFEKVKKVWAAFTTFLKPGIDWLKKTIGGLFGELFSKAPGRGFTGITPGTEIADTAKALVGVGKAAANADPLVGRLVDTLTEFEWSTITDRIGMDGRVMAKSIDGVAEAAAHADPLVGRLADTLTEWDWSTVTERISANGYVVAEGLSAMGDAAGKADPLVGRLASTLTESELASVMDRIAEDGYVVAEGFWEMGAAGSAAEQALGAMRKEARDLDPLVGRLASTLTELEKSQVIGRIAEDGYVVAEGFWEMGAAAGEAAESGDALTVAAQTAGAAMGAVGTTAARVTPTLYALSDATKIVAEDGSTVTAGFYKIGESMRVVTTDGREVEAALYGISDATKIMAEDGSTVTAGFYKIDAAAKILAEDGSLVALSFYDMGTATDTLTVATQGAGKAMSSMGESAGAAAESGAAMGTALDGVSESWGETWTELASVVGTGATEIVALVGTMRDGVVADFAEMNQAVVGGSIVPDMVTGILGWFGTLVTQGIALFAGLKTSVLGILGSLAEEAFEKGKALATRFGEGVKKALNKALAAARAIAAAIRALLPGSDAETGPLSDLFASGRALPETLAKGMIAGMSPLNRQINSMAANMRPAGANAPGAQLPGRTTTNNITIMNPSPQAAERSISSTMRMLSMLGVA